MQKTPVRFLGEEDLLEEGMATHSSILAWRNPRGQRSLVGYNPRGRKESDMSESLSTAQHRALRVPEPFSRFSLFIYFTHSISRVYMSIHLAIHPTAIKMYGVHTFVLSV